MTVSHYEKFKQVKMLFSLHVTFPLFLLLGALNSTFTGTLLFFTPHISRLVLHSFCEHRHDDVSPLDLWPPTSPRPTVETNMFTVFMSSSPVCPRSAHAAGSAGHFRNPPGGSRVFPGKTGSIIFLRGCGCTRGSLPQWAWPEHLQREALGFLIPANCRLLVHERVPV